MNFDRGNFTPKKDQNDDDHKAFQLNFNYPKSEHNKNPFRKFSETQ